MSTGIIIILKIFLSLIPNTRLTRCSKSVFTLIPPLGKRYYSINVPLFTYPHKDHCMQPTTELIVALDLPNARAIDPLLDKLPPAIRWFKVGLELFTAEGPACLHALQQRHLKIFLDLKLHDIPNTVAHAVSAAARHGVGMLTVHASGGSGMLKAAVEAAAQSGSHAPKIIAVTTLTSLNQADLDQQGITRPLSHHTLAMGSMAIAAGVNGLVCSPQEAAAFRHQLGPAPLLVTPGIRPAGSAVGDQKRTGTPAQAVRDGSNFLVVGRPIVQATDPAAAAGSILNEMQISSG